jgi:NAD(P)-dependent dehydrogenase (short-subunit alcohol dehydrogenase family)
MEGSKAVLVTGASTGIGRKITERLAGEGHLVYAGARKDVDLQALAGIDNVQPLRLDVTNQDDITAAVHIVTNRGRGLYGLVNNAGVLTLGSVVEGSDKEFDLVMAVNLYGPYRVTRAFWHLIVASKGRIVTIGSVAGLRGVPNAGAYSMSKHAVEGFTDALAEEMKPHGVEVSIVEPGSFNTNIAENAIRRLGENQRLLDFKNYKAPDAVSEAVALALFEHHPKRRYFVASDEQEAQRTIRRQIERLIQLNEGHSYAYKKSALIEMVDEALASSRH